MCMHACTHTYHPAIVTVVLIRMAGKEKRSSIEAALRSEVSPFFNVTPGNGLFPLDTASVFNTCRASSVHPFNSNHLGDSGIILYVYGSQISAETNLLQHML